MIVSHDPQTRKRTAKPGQGRPMPGCNRLRYGRTTPEPYGTSGRVMSPLCVLAESVTVSVCTVLPYWSFTTQ